MTDPTDVLTCATCLNGAAVPNDAEAIRWLADLMEFVITNGDVAEVAAPVPGEVGRASAVAARDARYEDPVAWTREQADSLAEGASDRRPVEVDVADAWDAGYTQGYENGALQLRAGSGANPHRVALVTGDRTSEPGQDERKWKHCRPIEPHPAIPLAGTVSTQVRATGKPGAECSTCGEALWRPVEVDGGEREALATEICTATHPTRWEYQVLSRPCDGCHASADAVLAAGYRLHDEGLREQRERVRGWVVARDAFYGREAGLDDEFATEAVYGPGGVEGHASLLLSDVRALVGAPGPEAYDDRLNGGTDR